MLTVQTQYGLLEGVQREGYTTFFGVPYAKPPIGELRWKRPERPACWSGIRKADVFSHRAWQTVQEPPRDGNGINYAKEFYENPEFMPEMDEDCLYLNIWTPAVSAGEKLPVAFYIHGGAFLNGFGSEIEFDGEGFARRGVILVTINYRLGAFGFFCHPDLKNEDPDGCCGNYGIYDQLAALAWVRENIAAFGGDPDKITIFGQSAGAMSVQALVSSPLTKGMIAGAIMQSGGSYKGRMNSSRTLEQALTLGRKYMEICGAENLQQMRELPPEKLMAGLFQLMPVSFGMGLGLPFTPVMDGVLLTADYNDILEKGDYPDIPYMLGSCLNDMMVQPGTDGRNSSIYCGCVNWSLINQLHGRKPAYIYQFCRQLPGDNQGAFHSSELWYVFRTLGRCWRPMTDADMRLADQICDYWCNFVKSGDPNGDGLPNWAPCCWEDHNVQMLDIEHE